MRQNAVRRARNKSLRSEMKTSVKKVVLAVKDSKKDEAVKLLNTAYSFLDTAVKKNLMHANNAARKKSQLAKAIDSLK